METVTVDGVCVDVEYTGLGLFYGSSPDMPGLHLIACSMDEMIAEAKSGIRDLRMVNGFRLFLNANNN